MPNYVQDMTNQTIYNTEANGLNLFFFLIISGQVIQDDRSGKV